MADENKPEASATPPADAGSKSAASAATPKPAAPKTAAGGGGSKAAAGPPLPVDPAPPADLESPAFMQALCAAFPADVVRTSYWVGDWTVIVPADRLLDVARFLREAPEALFDYCSDVSAVDWPARAPQRFDIVYCLYSTTLRQRVRVKTHAGEQDAVPSVTALWPAANWLEREVFDMFGVRFAGHPDLRRILMPEDWQGHPERKDYPLEGPGELILESPQEWLKLRQAAEESEIE